jgi:hypothetical protein
MSAVKGWRCPFPSCGKPIRADTLEKYRISWAVVDVGRWRVDGFCPHCHRHVLFTKHGARVIGECPAPLPAPVAMRHEIVVRRRRVQ